MDVAILLIIFLLLAFFFFCFYFSDTLRLTLLTKPFLTWFRRRLPPLSQAEKEALQMGGVWWEGQFFSGNPDWSALLKLEKPVLKAEEQYFLDHQVEALCSLIDDWPMMHVLDDLPEAAWEYIKKEKFWGLVVSRQYGGLGFSAIAHSAIVKKIASRSLSAAITVMVPNSLGPAEFIEHYGTQAQRDYYLPRLVRGEEVGCFALTATEAGSDATALTDTGVVCRGEYEGESVIGIRLNWSKRYITLAPVATLIGLAFKLYDPDHFLGDKENLGITVAMIPSRLPGIALGARHKPLNLAFMNGTLAGKDVFIPLNFIVGGVARCGDGWEMMMESLALGRGISLPSLATAATHVAFRSTTAYAQVREQFNRPIGDFEGVALPLAKIGLYSYLSEATRLFTAQAVDQDVRPSVASAIAKYHLTEMAREAINHAMDIHGGRGIQMGPRNYLAYFYQGIPIAITVEGANILTRNLIIYGQGVMRCHPYLQEEVAAAENSDGLQAFDRALWRHVAALACQVFRAFRYALTGARCVVIPASFEFAPLLRQLTRMSNAFALLSDMTLGVLGSKIKFKESLSARLGDALSHFYLASAVMKYFNDRGQPPSERPLVEACLRYHLWCIQEALIVFLENFPNRWVAFFMRRLLFPWGRPYTFPADDLMLKVAEAMQHDLSLRDTLTSEHYRGSSPKDAIAVLEEAFSGLQAHRPLLNKLKNAAKDGMMHKAMGWSLRIDAAFEAGMLSLEERDQLKTLDALCWEAMSVDAFPKDTA